MTQRWRKKAAHHRHESRQRQLQAVYEALAGEPERWPYDPDPLEFLNQFDGMKMVQLFMDGMLAEGIS